MDETTREIIRSITVRYQQETTLPGGHSGLVFYDCARLTPSQLSRLAASAMWEEQHFDCDVVVGLAYRGIFFAAAIAAGKPAAILQADGEVFGPDLKGKKIIIVDDVVVGGATLLRAKNKLEGLGAIVVAFACIVDRSGHHGKIDLGYPLVSSYRTVLE